jgi:hypothetical protein
MLRGITHACYAAKSKSARQDRSCRADFSVLDILSRTITFVVDYTTQRDKQNISMAKNSGGVIHERQASG